MNSEKETDTLPLTEDPAGPRVPVADAGNASSAVPGSDAIPGDAVGVDPVASDAPAIPADSGASVASAPPAPPAELVVKPKGRGKAKQEGKGGKHDSAPIVSTDVLDEPADDLPPDPPARDPMLGDMTPAFVDWAIQYYPRTAAKDYAERMDRLSESQRQALAAALKEVDGE